MRNSGYSAGSAANPFDIAAVLCQYIDLQNLDLIGEENHVDALCSRFRRMRGPDGGFSKMRNPERGFECCHGNPYIGGFAVCMAHGIFDRRSGRNRGPQQPKLYIFDIIWTFHRRLLALLL